MPATKSPPHPLTDAEIKSRTGKTWDQWFKMLDDLGGPARGRREIGNTLIETHKLDPWLSSTLIVEYEAARGVVEKDGRPKGYMICATKTIAAGPDKAYGAWSSARALERWLGAGCKVELKEGGRFALPDGGAGEFKKIRENKAIKFTWEHAEHTPGSIVEVSFQPKGDKCTVMIAHDRIQTRAEADGLRESWGAALDKLKAVLEGK